MFGAIVMTVISFTDTNSTNYQAFALVGSNAFFYAYYNIFANSFGPDLMLVFPSTPRYTISSYYAISFLKIRKEGGGSSNVGKIKNVYVSYGGSITAGTGDLGKDVTLLVSNPVLIDLLL